MSSNQPPAFFSPCACDTGECPNQILYVNWENLFSEIQGGQNLYAEFADEMNERLEGCIPIGSFTPNEIGSMFHSSILAANE